MNGLALCAGFGGIEQGLESILPDYSTVCYVEGEAYPVAVLIEKMEKGRIHPAPIWSDLRTFEGTRWRGTVDIISGGFPCQPYSQAGKLRGKDDARNLWPDVVRIISEVRPKIIFMENVPNINNKYGSQIIGDLAKMGFDAAWCIVRASDVGAPHKRSRWFLLAYAHLPDSQCDGCAKNGQRDRSCLLARKCQKMEKERHKQAFSFANGGSNKRDKPNKRPVYNQFDKGWWEIEPPVGRMVDGVANWSYRIRGCGNGVVPRQAAYAFQILAERLACGIDANLDPKGC